MNRLLFKEIYELGGGPTTGTGVVTGCFAHEESSAAKSMLAANRDTGLWNVFKEKNPSRYYCLLWVDHSGKPSRCAISQIAAEFDSRSSIAGHKVNQTFSNVFDTLYSQMLVFYAAGSITNNLH